MEFCSTHDRGLSSFGTKILGKCGISFNKITKKMTFIADIFLPGVQYTAYYSRLMFYLTMTFVMSRVPHCPYSNNMSGTGYYINAVGFLEFTGTSLCCDIIIAKIVTIISQPPLLNVLILLPQGNIECR